MRAAAAPAAASATQTPKVARTRPAPIPPPLPARRTAASAMRGAERAGGDPEQEALERRQPDQVAAAGAARAKQREVRRSRSAVPSAAR